MTDPPESQRQIAARLSKELGFPVTRDQVRGWIGRGFDMNDTEALTHQLRQTERPPKGLTKPRKPSEGTATASQVSSKPLTPEQLDARLVALESELLIAGDYETARTIRVQISGCRELFRIQTERGNYVLRDTVEQFVMHIATASRAKWENLENDLPPILEGMDTASKMAKEIRAYSRIACQELADIFGRPNSS